MVIGKEDANLQEIVKQNIDNAMQPKQAAAAAAGGSRKKNINGQNHTNK